MNSGIDISLVKKTYEKMDDQELIRIITQDAYGLTPEAQEIIKTEIAKRNIDQSIVSAIEAQNKVHSRQEIDEYCELLRGLNCPSCGSAFQKLNGTLIGEVTSYIFFTQYKKELKIACPGCLDKMVQNAFTRTGILGWWGIPWGIIKTMQALDLNAKSKRSHHEDGPNEFLISFVLERIGEIEVAKNNRNQLQILISGKSK